MAAPTDQPLDERDQEEHERQPYEPPTVESIRLSEEAAEALT